MQYFYGITYCILCFVFHVFFEIRIPKKFSVCIFILISFQAYDTKNTFQAVPGRFALGRFALIY
jgi:hypothetical protein